MTTVEFETLGDTHDNRLNFTLSRIVWEAMEAVGTPCFTEEETAYARQIAQHAGVPGFTGDFDTRIVSADRTIKIDNGSHRPGGCQPGGAHHQYVWPPALRPTPPCTPGR